MVERRTIGDVYEAVMALRGELQQQLAQHETRISLLENGRRQVQTERTDIRTGLEKLEEGVTGLQISRAKSAGIGALVGAPIVVIPQITFAGNVSVRDDRDIDLITDKVSRKLAARFSTMDRWGAQVTQDD